MQCKSSNSGPVLKGLNLPPEYKWKLNFQLCNMFGHCLCLSGIPIPPFFHWLCSNTHSPIFLPIPPIESSASAQLCLRRGLVGQQQIGVIWSPKQPFFNKIVNISQNSQFASEIRQSAKKRFSPSQTDFCDILLCYTTCVVVCWWWYIDNVKKLSWQRWWKTVQFMFMSFI